MSLCLSIPEKTRFFATDDQTAYCNGGIYTSRDGSKHPFCDYHLENGLLKLILIGECEACAEETYTEVALITDPVILADWNWFANGVKPEPTTEILKVAVSNGHNSRILVRLVYENGEIEYSIIETDLFSGKLIYYRFFSKESAAQEAF